MRPRDKARRERHPIPEAYQDKSEQWKSSFAFHLDYCQHYNPEPRKDNDCDLGVDAETLTLGFKLARPCICSLAKDSGKPIAVCEKFRERTTESAVDYANTVEKSMEQFLTTLPWIGKIKEQCQGKKTDQQGIDTCPVCSKRIGWSWTPDNGHMSARCETEDCVNFIE